MALSNLLMDDVEGEERGRSSRNRRSRPSQSSSVQAFIMLKRECQISKYTPG